jgi:hypothetical protein
MPDNVEKSLIKEKGKMTPERKKADFIKIRAQSSERSSLQNKREVAQGRTSSIPGLTTKLYSKRSDANLEVRQRTWERKPKPADHVASTSRERQLNTARQYWRRMQYSASASNPSRRAFSAGQKEIPALAGGADPEDTTSQQQQLQAAYDSLQTTIKESEISLRDENLYGPVRDVVQENLEIFKSARDELSEDLKTPEQKQREESRRNTLRSMR